MYYQIIFLKIANILCEGNFTSVTSHAFQVISLLCESTLKEEKNSSLILFSLSGSNFLQLSSSSHTTFFVLSLNLYFLLFLFSLFLSVSICCKELSSFPKVFLKSNISLSLSLFEKKLIQGLNLSLLQQFFATQFFQLFEK